MLCCLLLLRLLGLFLGFLFLVFFLFFLGSKDSVPVLQPWPSFPKCPHHFRSPPHHSQQLLQLFGNSLWDFNLEMDKKLLNTLSSQHQMLHPAVGTFILTCPVNILTSMTFLVRRFVVHVFKSALDFSFLSFFLFFLGSKDPDKC